eukprot:TRINITY_DN55312_c0_g1_i1.p1 TRINITY_DN55312_c0_g1~~TRINITY_DN55312_c0_g1_i1.p1  ORF type:complete len:229 (-),score=28.95 TRINITY_DN55312_c0_g1_i1:164-814(-)
MAASCGHSLLSQTLVERNEHGNSGLIWVCLVYFGWGALIMANYILCSVYLQKYATEDRPIGAALVWGRINDPGYEWLMNVYLTGFLVATIGFFLNLNYILRVANLLRSIDDGAVLKAICMVYSFFFITEQTWMPMCIMYLAHNSIFLFIVIRIQLFASGVSGIAWAVLIYQSTKLVGDSVGSATKCAGVLGACVFAGHCFCLDCCVWPPFFEGVTP